MEEFREAKAERENGGTTDTPLSPDKTPKKSSSKLNLAASLNDTVAPKMPSRARSNTLFMKDGWLDKKSKDIRKQWKRRYFVCTSTTLNYYKSQKVCEK